MPGIVCEAEERQRQKKKIERIVLDLDDTLNSLTMHLLGAYGAKCGPMDYDKYPTEVGYDIVAAWSQMTGEDPIPVPEWWEKVSRRMWAIAPKSEQFWLLDNCARLVGRENVQIATAPTKCGDCLAGKYDWMDKNLPSWCQRQYSVTPRKEWLAQPGVLLIDDSAENCMNFIYKKDKSLTGGCALLVPRPWNWAYHEDTNDWLLTGLELYDFG